VSQAVGNPPLTSNVMGTATKICVSIRENSPNLLFPKTQMDTASSRSSANPLAPVVGTRNQAGEFKLMQ